MRTAVLSFATLLTLSAFSEAAFASKNRTEPASWTGIYAGVNAGYGWLDLGFPDFPEAESIIEPGKGFLVGGTLGFNYQIDRFLIGGEFDLSGSSIKSTTVFSEPYVSTTTVVFGLERVASIKARFGAAFDKALVYGTAGWAWGALSYQEQVADSMGTDLYSDTSHASGAVFGGGVEWKLNDNLSLRTEVLRFNLKPSFSLGDPTEPPAKAEFEVTTVRAGLNFHFK